MWSACNLFWPWPSNSKAMSSHHSYHHSWVCWDGPQQTTRHSTEVNTGCKIHTRNWAGTQGAPIQPLLMLRTISTTLTLTQCVHINSRHGVVNVPVFHGLRGTNWLTQVLILTYKWEKENVSLLHHRCTLLKPCLQIKDFPTYHMVPVNIQNVMLNNVYSIETLIWVWASKN